MTGFTAPLHDAKQHAQQVRRQASPFIEKFARVGYAAKGVVYLLVGTLAAMAAFGAGGQTDGSRGALQTILEQPFGRILLGIVAAGLAGYSLWQFIRAIEDPENEGSDTKGIAKRIGYFISGVVHFGLVIAAISMITGSGSGGGGSDDAGAQSWTARVLNWPLGPWLVGAAGVGIAGYGIQQLIRAYKADLGKKLSLGAISATVRTWIVRLSRFGLAARGVVFGMIGAFVLIAAYRHDPSEARGLGGALRTLEQQPYGPWLLGIVALGLASYGVYELVKARYRRIDAD